MKSAYKTAHSHNTLLSFILLFFLTLNTVNATRPVGAEDHIADDISDTQRISETDIILLSTRPRIELEPHQLRALEMYQNQIQDYYDMKALSLHEGSKIINIQLEKWSEIPVAKDFITGQIRTLDTACSLNLQLDPGPLAVEKLERPVINLIVKIINDLHIGNPPEIYSASRKVEAFDVLIARVSAWLAAWPELTPETIALSVREDQKYDSSECKTLDSYQAQLQKHYYRKVQVQFMRYYEGWRGLKQHFNSLALEKFAELRALVDSSECRVLFEDEPKLLQIIDSKGPITDLVEELRKRVHQDLFVRNPPRYTSMDMIERIIASVAGLTENLRAYMRPFHIKNDVVGTCAICIEEYGSVEEKREPLRDLKKSETDLSHNNVAELECKHLFHADCILAWFVVDNGDLKEKPCPMCRRPFGLS